MKRFQPENGTTNGTRRRMQIPKRQGSKIEVIQPDGSRFEIDAMTAVQQWYLWNDVVGGLAVWYSMERD